MEGLALLFLVGLFFLFMLRGGGCCGGGGKDKSFRKGGERKMEGKVKDPVCGMEVDKDTAVAESEYMGKTFYFCSPGCKAEFDLNPEKYIREMKGDSCH